MHKYELYGVYGAKKQYQISEGAWEGEAKIYQVAIRSGEF